MFSFYLSFFRYQLVTFINKLLQDNSPNSLLTLVNSYKLNIIYSQNHKTYQLMNTTNHFQPFRTDNSALLMEEFYRMKAKHSKPKSLPKRFSDPVNTQIYVHQFQELKGLPPIKDSYSYKLQNSRVDQISERKQNFTEMKTRRCETIPYDMQCAGKFPNENTARKIVLENKIFKGKKFVEIDMLVLQTFYAKTRESSSKQKLGGGEETKNKDTINIPGKQSIAEFIKSYKVKNEHINVDDLVRSSYFGVQFNDKVSLYFGDIKQGNMDGKGIMITKNWIFEGQWSKSEKYQGVEITQKGIYKGKFIHSQRAKVGEFYWNNGEYYSGEWHKNKKHGTGVWKSVDGDVYMGQWNKGKVQGYGIHLTKTGQKYQGYFHNFLKHGQGKQHFPNGDHFEGVFKEGKPQGFGTYRWKNDITYQGQFKDGLREGKGKIRKQGLQYQGTFLRQKAHGQGKLTVFNGDNYKGEFKNGKKQGKGISRQKRKIYVGIWKNNHFVQKMD